jgi:ferredoxin-thioredoxin reductase catalytic subunit
MTTQKQIRQRAEQDAQTYGYALNPNPTILQPLLEGLQQNTARYGYPSCPCRMASGVFELDRDILCPCDYRDPDVLEHGYCYCALYVRRDMIDTPPDAFTPIPERRPEAKLTRAYGVLRDTTDVASAKPRIEVIRKLWYCQQCGYTVFREDPPFICPICKAKRERFAKIRLKTAPTS